MLDGFQYFDTQRIGSGQELKKIMIGYNEGTERSTTDRNFHITVQLLQYPPAVTVSSSC